MMKATRTLLLAIGLMAISADAGAEWPIDTFTAIQGRIADADAEATPRDWLGYAATEAKKAIQDAREPDLARKRELALQAWARLTERYLNIAATHYERAGFAPPRLSPIVERNGKRTYGVYLLEPHEVPEPKEAIYQRGARGTYDPSCGPDPLDDNEIIVLKTRFQFPGPGGEGPSLTKRVVNQLAKLPFYDQIRHLLPLEVSATGADEQSFFSTLAHELFHSIQKAHEERYGWKGFCATRWDTHRWITEGLADAAAHHVAGQVFPDFFQKGFGKRQGQRDYFDPLNAEAPNTPWSDASYNDTKVYATSSFWRYMVERKGSLSVLARLMKRSPDENSERGRLKWVEDFVRDEFNRYGLYHFWPEFITEYASYGGFRYRRGEQPTIDRALELNKEWLDRSSLYCKDVTLTPDNRVETVTLDPMEGLSASCINVDWHGFDDLVRPFAEMLSTNAQLLDQLHLGAAYAYDRKNQRLWTCYLNRGAENSPKPWCNGKEFQTTGPKMGEYAKSFGVDFMTFSGDAEVRFIVSNVARTPWKTKGTYSGGKGSEPRFRIGIQSTESTRNMGPPERLNEGGPGGPVTPGPNAPIGGPGTHSPVNIQEFASPSPDKDAEPIYGWGLSPAPGFEMPLGYTGPYHGDIWRNDPGADATASPDSGVGSMWCRIGGFLGRKAPIGEVLISSEEELRVRIEADVCTCEADTAKGGLDCRKVDRFNGQISLSSGWRAHGDTAPKKVPTPGQKANDERFDSGLPYLVAAALSGRAQQLKTWSPGEPDPFVPGPASSGAGGAATGVGGGALSSASCACTCDEKREMLDILDGVVEGDSTQALMCTSTCLAQYRACPATP